MLNKTLKLFFLFVQRYFGFVAGIIFLISFFLLNFGGVEAMTFTSDRISTSWPDVGSDHTITFQMTKNIPAGGRIVISFEDGFFTPAGFGVDGIDLATSTALAGIFSDRQLAVGANADSDGVSVQTETSASQVEFELNSTHGINSGEFVQIQIGRNADYQATSSLRIINPHDVRSYMVTIDIYNNTGSMIDKKEIMIAVARPVNMNAFAPKKRMSGSPDGWLSNGTTQTIMSLMTNFPAYCRYSTASNTPYSLMNDNFSYVGGFMSEYHTIILNNLLNGEEYQYFVRCRDIDGNMDDLTECYYDTPTTTMVLVGTELVATTTYITTSENCIDYEINFAVSSISGSGDDNTGTGEDETTGDSTDVVDGDSTDDSTGDTTGDSTGTSGTASGGGGSGGGSGGGAGSTFGNDRTRGVYLPYPPPPGESGVVLEGWAYPGRDVIILQDGKEVGIAATNVQAKFGGFIKDVAQGTYAFGIRSTDSSGVESLLYSTTFFVEKGTQSTVSDIILAPTISVNKNTFSAGEKLEIFGETAPSSVVEAWIFPSGVIKEDDESVIKKDGVSTGAGKWNFIIDTEELGAGTFNLKSRVKIEGVNYSEFGKKINISVGVVQGEEGVCAGADLNQDGKVNITDFSILLYYWGTNNACADQNHNGSVDLIDFSIMMYNWTG